jgi:hypothetical protein
MIAGCFPQTAVAQKRNAYAYYKAPRQVQIVVAPNGDDEAEGNLANPIRTLFEARERVRDLLIEQRGPDIEVLIQPGFYRQDSTLTFEAMDCSPHRKVTWQTPLGKKANLSGGALVLGWEPLKGGLWKAPCKHPAFRQLYVNGQRRQRARGLMPPDIQTLNKAGDSLVGYRSRLFQLTKGQTKHLELHYANGRGYSIMPVSNLQMDSTGEKQLVINPRWFALMSRKEGGAMTMPTHIEGSLALLDQPGEWYHDQEEGMLYYYPFASEDLTSAEVTVPVLTTIMQIAGSEEEPVINLKFKGLTFSEGNWAGPDNKPMLNVFANAMADTSSMSEVIDSLYIGPRYGEYQESPSHVVLKHCHGLTLYGCLFTRMGSQGLKLGEGCKDNLVEYALFEDISGNGLMIGGMDRIAHHPSDPRYIVERNTVRNCLVRRVGVDFTGAVGLLSTYASNTVIEMNEFTQLPYTAIALGWGWGRADSGGMAKQTRVFPTSSTAKNNIIRNNHIHKVMLRHAEGGAIYTMGAQPGSQIMDNVLYNNPQGYDILLGPGTANLEVGINKAGLGEATKAPTLGSQIMSSAREATVRIVQRPSVP